MVIIAIDKIFLGALRIERTVMLSIDIDSRGSAMYAFLNSGGDTKIMELLGQLYGEQPVDIHPIEETADKLYIYYKLTIPTKNVIIGRTDIEKTLPILEAEFPVPGAGKGGAIKDTVRVVS